MPNDTIEPIIVGPLETNCWLYPLIMTGGKRPCAVIDPGADPDCIITQMEKSHLYPGYFLLTHGHFDHIAALPELSARYPGVEVALHPEDRDFQWLNGMFGGLAGKNLAPGPFRFLDDGEQIGPFTVLHLPGHTPGGLAFYDKAAGLLFSGDTLFQGGDVGRTDLPGGDTVKLGASLRRLFSLDAAVQVYPGHGPATTIGDERQVLGMYLRDG